MTTLREKHGTPPNIIHIMFDDLAFGDLGIPQMAAIRGFNTPNIDRMAKEGAMFTRMYTEPACTPSRAAVITGRHPVRYGMGAVDWPLIFGGLAATRSPRPTCSPMPAMPRPSTPSGTWAMSRELLPQPGL